jgi:hypothetical protein
VTGYISGDKKFVLLMDDEVHVFDSAFDTVPLYVLRVEEIESIEPAKFDLTEIPMDTLVITMKNGTVKRLAWGETGIRGVWTRVLRKFEVKVLK